MISIKFCIAEYYEKFFFLFSLKSCRHNERSALKKLLGAHLGACLLSVHEHVWESERYYLSRLYYVTWQYQLSFKNFLDDPIFISVTNVTSIYSVLLTTELQSTVSDSIGLFLLHSALQPLVGFRPAQLSLSILSRKVLQSAVASCTSKPQLGGEPGI
jgi:hypothetical protein